MILTESVEPHFENIRKAFESGTLDDQIAAVTICYWDGYNHCAGEVEDEKKRLPESINLN